MNAKISKALLKWNSFGPGVLIFLAKQRHKDLKSSAVLEIFGPEVLIYLAKQ
jgi:hypothetical protein